MLDSSEVGALRNLIRDSFRVRENHTPIYVEIGDNLTRFASAQQQVLFGRRGSGKSCLLVHWLRISERDKQVLAVYIGMDELKRLGFPDVLIRLLLTIFQSLPGAKKSLFSWGSTPLRDVVAELATLLDQPESAEVSTRDTHGKTGESGVSAKASRGEASIKTSKSTEREVLKRFTGAKLDHLERHLQDYKKVLGEVLRLPKLKAYILVDDFYLVQKDMQPKVVDYLHRLLRGTDAYLKLATIRHRTILRRHEGQTIGVEISQDIEEISLDKTFEDFDSTHNYLHSMLQQMSNEYSQHAVVSDLFNADAGRALTLASGGVPRDFLNIFDEAIEQSIRAGKRERLTPTFINKAAASLSYKSKLANLKEEAGYDSQALEQIFSDLVDFCLREKKKTVFLINHDDAKNHPIEHELLQQLMDFKLIHLVDSNTSAASGRKGRFAAYTLDFSIFMEPRRRGIEIVEFWRVDDQRRPIGVRESPDYSLTRAAEVIADPQSDALGVDDLLDTIEVDENPSQLNTT